MSGSAVAMVPDGRPRLTPTATGIAFRHEFSLFALNGFYKVSGRCPGDDGGHAIENTSSAGVRRQYDRDNLDGAPNRGIGGRYSTGYPGFRWVWGGLPQGLLRLLPPKLLSRVARLSSGLPPRLWRAALLAELIGWGSAQGT
jgi:hypothetical protein